METDTVQDFETRKDGKFSFTVEIGGYGITANVGQGEVETSGMAQIILNREQVLRLFEALHKHLGES